METIKRGDRGEAVRLLQRSLSLKADGVFGVKTEAAVRAFQSGHGLTADGIVGPVTWALLGVTDTKAVDPSVVYLPLSVHVGKLAGRAIKYLAIHYTAGASSRAGSARAVKRVFESRNASADFAVDDKEAVQFNPDLRNYFCWAVGDRKAPGSITDATNRNTISIEICSTLRQGTAAVPNHDGWTFTEAALSNAAKLAKILMAKFGIPLDCVVRHYDITGKLCPGIVGWNNGRLFTMDGKATSHYNDSSVWEAFKKRLTL